MAKAKTTLVKARVLVKGKFGNCNDVVEVDNELAEDPELDAHPDAVAYAEQMKEGQ